MKSKILKEITFEIEKEKLKKKFEDDEVKDFYTQVAEPVEKRLQEHEQQLRELLQNNQKKIDQANIKIEVRKKEHLENYEREFDYKIKNDENLVHKKLNKAIPFIQSKSKTLDEQINYINTHKRTDFASLRNEIKQLEQQYFEMNQQIDKLAN
jgi:hypothetical protein